MLLLNTFRWDRHPQPIEQYALALGSLNPATNHLGTGATDVENCHLQATGLDIGPRAAPWGKAPDPLIESFGRTPDQAACVRFLRLPQQISTALQIEVIRRAAEQSV